MAMDRLNQYDNIGELHSVVEGLTITCIVPAKHTAILASPLRAG